MTLDQIHQPVLMSDLEDIQALPMEMERPSTSPARSHWH